MSSEAAPSHGATQTPPAQSVRNRRSVCVFCASSTEISQRYLDLAAEVGTNLGRRGYTLVSGGGSISSMGALAVAARGAGARTVGVIPEALLAYEVGDHDADELVVTADMRERKGVMDARADAFLVLPGGIGTLEEFFEAWVGSVLGMHSKPVVVLDPWDDYAALHQLLRDLVASRFVSIDVAARVVWTRGVSESLDAIERHWEQVGGQEFPSSLPQPTRGGTAGGGSAEAGVPVDLPTYLESD